MENVVVVRHGTYNVCGTHTDHSLTADGRWLMQLLGRHLSGIIPREGLEILSSPLKYACESADILANTFHVTSSVHQLLQVDPDYWIDEIDRVMEFIGEHAHAETGTLMLVTHNEYAQELLPRIARKRFPHKSSHNLSLGYAEAAILDWNRGDIQTIAPYAWMRR